MGKPSENASLTFSRQKSDQVGYRTKANSSHISLSKYVIQAKPEGYANDFTA